MAGVLPVDDPQKPALNLSALDEPQPEDTPETPAPAPSQPAAGGLNMSALDAPAAPDASPIDGNGGLDLSALGEGVDVSGYDWRTTQKTPEEQATFFGEMARAVYDGTAQLPSAQMANLAVATGDMELLKRAIDQSKAGYGPKVASISDVGLQGDYFGDFSRYLGYQIGNSMPEMLTVFGASLVGGLGGPGTALAAGVGTSSSFQTGRNFIRQMEETGQVDALPAVVGGIAGGALDYIVPGKVADDVAGAFTGRLLGTVLSKNAAKEIGWAIGTEGLTEAAQQVIEQWAANPENTRILLNPETPEEVDKSEALLVELVDALVAGGASGGAFAAGGQAATAVGNAVAGRAAEVEAGKSATIAEADADADEALQSTLNNKPETEKAPSGAPIEYRLGPNRPNKPDSDILSVISTSVQNIIPGAKVVVTSGKEDPGKQYGSDRHPTGKAADIAVILPDGSQLDVGANPDVAQQLALEFARNGATGIGFGAEYMGGNHFHVDLTQPKRGQSHVWGSGAIAGSPEILRTIRERGNIGVDPKAQREFVVNDYLDGIEQVESGGDPRAKNPRSSAAGNFQFTNGTWLQYVKSRRPDLAAGKTDDQIIAMRSDKALGREMATYYTEDSADALTASALPVTNANLGMLHRFGNAPQGEGIDIVRASIETPDAPVEQFVGAGVMAANPDLQGKTVGEVAQFYADRLGGSPSTFRGMTGSESLDRVATETNRKGAPLATAPDKLQRDAITEKMARIFGDVIPDETMPQGVRETIASKLMNAQSQNSPIVRLSQMAEGSLTIEGMALSESTSLAAKALREFGYEPGAVASSDPNQPPPKPRFGGEKVIPDSAPIIKAAGVQFSPADPNSLIRSQIGMKMLPDMVSQFADVLERKTGLSSAEHAQDVAAKLSKSKRRRKPTAAEKRAAADLRAFATLVDDLTSAKASDRKALSPAQRKIVARGIEAISMVDAPAAKAINTLVRQFNGRIDVNDKITRGRQAVAITAVKQLDERLSALAEQPKLNRDPTKVTKTGRFVTAKVITPAAESARKRNLALTEERMQQAAKEAAKQKREAQTLRATMRDEEAKRAALADMAAADAAVIKNAVENPVNPLNSPAGIVAGFMAAAQNTGQHIKAGQVAWKHWGLNMLEAMQPRQISESFGKLLPQVRVGLHKTDIMKAITEITSSADGVAMSLMDEGQRLALNINDWSRSMAGQKIGRHEFTANEAQRYLSQTLTEASVYEITLTDSNKKDAGGREAFFATEQEFLDSFLPADPEADRDKDGANAAITPEELEARREEMLDIWRRFNALPDSGKSLYRDVRDLFRNSQRRLVDGLISAAAADVIGPGSKIYDVATYYKYENELPTRERAVFQQVLRRAQLRGDYAPLEHGRGKWQIFASKTIFIQGKNDADAAAQMKALALSDPRVHPGSVKDGKATATITFYRRFESAKAAEDAAAELRATGYERPDGKRVGFDMVTPPQLAEEHNFTAAVPDNFAGELFGLLDEHKASQALKDGLMELLYYRNSGAVLSLRRKNVTGETSGIANSVRNTAIRQGRQLKQVLAEPHLKAARAEAQTQLDAWRKPTTGDVRRAVTTQAVMNHADKMMAIRTQSYHDGFAAGIKDMATRAGVIWYLSSVSYNLVNMVQPMAYGMPFMAARHGSKGVKELSAVYVKNLKEMAKLAAHAPSAAAHEVGAMLPDKYSGAKYDPARPRSAGQVAYVREIIQTDPKNPGIPLGSGVTTTRSPVDNSPVYLSANQYEYDQYGRGEISLEFLRFLSGLRNYGSMRSQIAEMGEPLPEPEVTESRASKARGAARRATNVLLDMTSYSAEHIEYFNRRTMVEAHYNMAKKANGGRAFTDAELDQLVKEADDLNYRVNTDNTQSNRSMLQNKAGPILLFSTFGHHMMYQTWKGFAAMTGITPDLTPRERAEGAVIFTAYVGTHLGLAGIAASIPQWAQVAGGVGFMAADTLVDLFQEVFGIGDDEDELDKLRTIGFWAYAEGFSRENLGDEFTDLFFNGVVSEVLNVDLSSQFSLANGYTFINPEAPKDVDSYNALLVTLMGPVAGIGKQLVNGVDKLNAEGWSTSGIVEHLFPLKIGRNIARAFNQSEDGVRTRSGNVIISPDEIGFLSGTLAQMFGFTSQETADMYDRRNMDFALRTKLEDNRKDLLTRYRRKDTLSPGERLQLTKDIQTFNDQVSGRDKITGATKVRALMESRAAERTMGKTGGTDSQHKTVSKEVERIYGDGN